MIPDPLRHGFSIDDGMDPQITKIDIGLNDATLYINDGTKSGMEVHFAEPTMNLDQKLPARVFERNISKLKDNIEKAIEAGFKPIISTWNKFGEFPDERQLMTGIGEHAKIISPGHKGPVFQHEIDDGYFIVLLAKAELPEQFPAFVRSYLCYLTRKSLEQRRKPNIKLHVPTLIRCIEEIVESEIRILAPETIALYVPRKPARKENTPYVRAIVEDNSSSFTYDENLEKLAFELSKDKKTGIQKSKAIFNWIRENIEYDHEKTKEKPYKIYRGALQTFHNRRGICGEMAALQVTMERLAGERAYLAEVGENHAIAVHITPSNRSLLIDTTTKDGFDCKYHTYKILADDKSLAHNPEF